MLDTSCRAIRALLFEYSDVGFGLPGHALAQLEHTTYGALAKEQLLKPLGMTMSDTASTDAVRAHLVPGHGSADEAAMSWDIPGLAGTGAIRSYDMLRCGVGSWRVAETVASE